MILEDQRALETDLALPSVGMLLLERLGLTFATAESLSPQDIALHVSVYPKVAQETFTSFLQT